MDRLSHSVQDYIKTIYLQTCRGEPTSTAALARALGIRSASVTNMLQKLADTSPGLVNYKKHYGVTLTLDGEKVALQIIRRHRLLEQYLFEILDYPLDKIHDEADQLEHVVSPFFVERIAKILQDPAFDPHGDPIPDRELKITDSRNLVLLTELEPGESGVVRLITDQSEDLLIYLHTIGICPGTEIRIAQKNPIDSTQQVEILETGESLVLGKAIGEQIQLEVNRS